MALVTFEAIKPTARPLKRKAQEGIASSLDWLRISFASISSFAFSDSDARVAIHALAAFC